MSVFSNISTSTFGPFIHPSSLLLMNSLPSRIVRCLGLEISSIGSGIDLLLAIDLENLDQAAISLNNIPGQERLQLQLKNLARQPSLKTMIDHLWLELDYQHPDCCSTFLGFPGNVQSPAERERLLAMMEEALIEKTDAQESNRVYQAIRNILASSGLLERINSGGHIISEVGWMDRPGNNHLKLLITPGYRQHASTFLQNLLGEAIADGIKTSILATLSNVTNIENEPLNLHLSVAINHESLRVAVEISHTPTQESCQYDTEFCHNILQLSGLAQRGAKIFKQFQAWNQSQDAESAKALISQLSHIKIPLAALSVNIDDSKFYIRLLPRMPSKLGYKSKP